MAPPQSLVPDLPDVTVHMVLDDLGRLGRVWRELGEDDTDEGSIVQAIGRGEFEQPVQVVAVNLAGGWCRDVTEDIARAVRQQAIAAGCTLGPGAARFVERATGEPLPRHLASQD